MRDIPVKNTFARSQRIMHWLVLLMIVIAYAAMELKALPPRAARRARCWFSPITPGVSVLILMVVRVGLKLTHHDPDIIPQPPRWQTISAKAVHGLLYLMFLSLPLLGVLSLYVGQVEWSFLGLQMPIAAAKNPELQHSLKSVHELIANAGYFLVGLHAAAALFHHYIVRDNTLERMLPFMHPRANRK
jgi:cytochrome b561